jgi:hypothetical protein
MEDIMYPRLRWELPAISNSSKSLYHLIRPKIARAKLGGGGGRDAHRRALL